MSTHADMGNNILLPMTTAIARALTARPSSTTPHTKHPNQSADLHWKPMEPAVPTRGVNRAAMLAVVVLLHALVLYVLSRTANPHHQEAIASIQMVSIELPQSHQSSPRTPAPAMINMNLPQLIEPVVEIVSGEPTHSISMAPPASDSLGTDTPQNVTPRTVSSVEYIREPIAKYPPAARALKQRGTVTLRALIGTDGRAREVNVQTSSGFRLLDDTAREAVANALFKPYTEDGRFIPVYVFIPIEFGAQS